MPVNTDDARWNRARIPFDRDLKRDPFPVGSREGPSKWGVGWRADDGAASALSQDPSDGLSCQWCADFLAAAPAHLN